MKKKFVITSLLAAGFLPPQIVPATPATPTSDLKPDPKGSLFKVFKLDHRYTLAAHRSHSSHSSHGSHRSSSGSGYSVPSSRRNTNSTPPSSILPSSPSTTGRGLLDLPMKLPPDPTPARPSSPTPLVTLPGNSDKFKRIVMQVQTALFAYGYYTGAIDGLIGPESRTALSKMQADYGLKVTGTITPEVLNALGIVAQ